MKKAALILVAVAMLAGCDDKLTKEQKAAASQVGIATSESIMVQRVGMVSDSLAYGDYRGIYIITDKRTGKEYIGVSGIGISEVGSHTEGKVTKRDER